MAQSGRLGIIPATRPPRALSHPRGSSPGLNIAPPFQHLGLGGAGTDLTPDVPESRRAPLSPAAQEG
jgi:hypothetical protein